MTRKTWGYLTIGLIVLILLIQFIPVFPADNPTVEEAVVAPPEVMTLLKRACYDCHSNETEWPWYNAVAPARWMLRHDVIEARQHLNFSTWNRYDAGQRAKKWEEVAEEVGDGEMPPFAYRLMHPPARLTDQEREVIRSWALAHAGDRGPEEQGEPPLDTTAAGATR